MTGGEQLFECPLCGIDFEGTTCHAACPLARACAMVRCPACGYEFVQDGFITRLLRRIRPAARDSQREAS
jgi:hypothetical protein